MSEGYLQLPKDLSAVPLPTHLLSNEQSTQIKVAKLNAGTFYAFQLSARNACGETVSSVQWFQTQASTPAAPQPPRCTTASNTSLSLSWDALPESACNGSAVDSYVLQVSESGDWRVTHNDASTSLWLAHGVMSSAVLRGLRPNTTYAFRLCAHNAEGNSAFSTPVSFISFCCTRCVLHHTPPCLACRRHLPSCPLRWPSDTPATVCSFATSRTRPLPRPSTPTVSLFFVIKTSSRRSKPLNSHTVFRTSFPAPPTRCFFFSLSS